MAIPNNAVDAQCTQTFAPYLKHLNGNRPGYHTTGASSYLYGLEYFLEKPGPLRRSFPTSVLGFLLCWSLVLLGRITWRLVRVLRRSRMYGSRCTGAEREGYWLVPVAVSTISPSFAFPTLYTHAGEENIVDPSGRQFLETPQSCSTGICLLLKSTPVVPYIITTASIPKNTAVDHL